MKCVHKWLGLGNIIMSEVTQIQKDDMCSHSDVSPTVESLDLLVQLPDLSQEVHLPRRQLSVKKLTTAKVQGRGGQGELSHKTFNSLLLRLRGHPGRETERLKKPEVRQDQSKILYLWTCGVHGSCGFLHKT